MLHGLFTCVIVPHPSVLLPPPLALPPDLLRAGPHIFLSWPLLRPRPRPYPLPHPRPRPRLQEMIGGVVIGRGGQGGDFNAAVGIVLIEGGCFGVALTTALGLLGRL
jgi:hypothetical protein